MTVWESDVRGKGFFFGRREFFTPCPFSHLWEVSRTVEVYPELSFLSPPFPKHQQGAILPLPLLSWTLQHLAQGPTRHQTSGRFQGGIRQCFGAKTLNVPNIAFEKWRILFLVGRRDGTSVRNLHAADKEGKETPTPSMRKKAVEEKKKGKAPPWETKVKSKTVKKKTCCQMASAENVCQRVQNRYRK